MEKLDDLIRGISDGGCFLRLKRLNYSKAYPYTDALMEIQAIGNFRSPQFVIDDNNKFAYINLAKWMVGDPTMQCINPDTGLVEAGSLDKGVYLAGGTGTGKTWAIQIVSYLASAHRLGVELGGRQVPMAVQVVQSSRLVDDFIRGENCENATRTFLCINDLGAEPREAVYMGNRKDVIRDLICDRGERQDVVTCFTSNYPIGHPSMVERYGDRCVSRLRQMCNYLEMRGEDRRK